MSFNLSTLLPTCTGVKEFTLIRFYTLTFIRFFTFLQDLFHPTFVDVNGYFEKPVSSFEEFVLILMQSMQSQASSTILTPTYKMIDREMERFKIVGSQLLRNVFTANDKAARIKLRTCLAGLFCDLSTIATSANTNQHHFAASLEHCVTSDTSKPHYMDIAVFSCMPNGSDDGKLCVLVELKCSGVKSIQQSGFQNAFSQLMHAAALAFNAKQWDKQLCCCLGSLTHWHVFLLKVVTDPERDCRAFQILHYNVFALPKELSDWNSSESEVVSMYKTLFEHLLCLLKGWPAQGPD